MRARQLKPGFFKNEDLAECSPLARILFEGLWCMADRSGRLEDRPKLIKAEILPYDNVDASALMDELEKWGFILRYEVEGKKFIWVKNFKKHQNPHYSEKVSEFPPHPSDAYSGSLRDDSGNTPGVAQENSQHNRASSLTPSSLTPDSLTPSSHEPDIRDGGQDQADVISLEIQQIGEGYPSDKYDPGAAEIAMKALSKARKWPGLTRILEDLAIRLASFDWTKEEGRFVPMLSTYIAKRMWLNPMPAARASPEALPAGMSDEEYERMMATGT